MSGEVFEKASIEVKVYRDIEGDLRWQIRSSKRGKRIIADSGQGYSRKADVFRGLLLVTGGRYVRTYRMRGAGDGWAYEQGSILRRTPEGIVEDVFVQYVSAPQVGA